MIKTEEVYSTFLLILIKKTTPWCVFYKIYLFSRLGTPHTVKLKIFIPYCFASYAMDKVKIIRWKNSGRLNRVIESSKNRNLNKFNFSSFF